MNTLFPLAPNYPDGFSYEPDFIPAGEEADLLNVIRQTTLHTFRFQGYAAKRRVASFGYDWNFETQTLSRGNAISQAFEWLIRWVAAKRSFSPELFTELLVTEYPVGAVINWHRDAPPFALIAGLSPGADCSFKLRPGEKEKQSRKATLTLVLQRRSLYTPEAEARDAWQHSIAPLAHVRYSITLRTLRTEIARK